MTGDKFQEKETLKEKVLYFSKTPLRTQNFRDIIFLFFTLMGEKDSPSEKINRGFFFSLSGTINLFGAEPTFIKINEGVEKEVQNRLNLLQGT